MSNFKTLKYRRSTDSLTPNKWFVYRALDGSHESLVQECDSKEEAENLFRDMLKEEVDTAVSQLEKNKFVSHEFFNQCQANGDGLIFTIERFFSEHSFDISKLAPLGGKVDDFSTETKKLSRPYIAVSEGDYRKLVNQTHGDYFMTSGGTVVTFGGAVVEGSDSGFALMPLNHKEAQKIIDQSGSL
ncbi:hypothetical protein [Vibrio crassostreae]|uniref:hypothetical protein n=1 Tax=Vibrio crassostreae TaxID=246167 RepID=UPI001B313F52|nr:hypothetical protein [Vibrio crassostreae]